MAEAQAALYNALKVITETDHIANYLALNDPKALAQANEAMSLAEEPACDICGEPEGEGEADWNGETGNHASCERTLEATLLAVDASDVPDYSKAYIRNHL